LQQACSASSQSSPSSSHPGSITDAHADAPPLESDDDDDDNGEDEDEEGEGMGELSAGVRFVAEYPNGDLEELEPPPPDMAAEVRCHVEVVFWLCVWMIDSSMDRWAGG
jgi:hypothetical protein